MTFEKYQKKEEKALQSIADTMNDLDDQVEKVEDTGSYFAEHKAIHDIKKILHKEGLYEKYVDREAEKAEELEDSYSY